MMMMMMNVGNVERKLKTQTMSDR